MKKLVPIGVALAALLAATPALAKVLTLERVCGTNGCHAVTPAIALGHDGFGAGSPTPAVEDYYVVKVGLGDGGEVFDRIDMYFAPEAGEVTASETGPIEGWATIPATAAEKLRAAARGLVPYRAPQPNRVDIGNRRSVDPAAYVDLIGPLQPTGFPVTSETPVAISISWPRQNPWSYGGAAVNYLPKARVVIRGDGTYRVPESLSSRIDRERRGLSPLAGGGFPWSVVGGASGGALVLLSAGLLLVRRRRPPASERPVPA